MTKLTLSADRELIAEAKRIAARRNTSVSAMVSRMFRAVAARDSTVDRLPPITTAASGLIQLSGTPDDQVVLENALAERYGVSQ